MKPAKPLNGVPAEITLAIQSTVEERLLKLPAETYKVIEQIVEKKVASVERYYRGMAAIAGVALTIVAVYCYNATAENASKEF